MNKKKGAEYFVEIGEQDFYDMLDSEEYAAYGEWWA
jgi:hypothetical protein